VTETFADLRAEAVAALDALAHVTPKDVKADTENAPPGHTIWRAGRAFVCLPTMRRDAPPVAVARYWFRIHAGLTGECALCGKVVNLTSDLFTAAFLVLPVTIMLVHDDACPARFTEVDRHLFEQEAWPS